MMRFQTHFQRTVFLFFIVSLALVSTRLVACTNLLVSRGASKDGSTFLTYAADSHVLYGELYYTPARSHVPGSMLEIYEWDTGRHLGAIREVAYTYAVVGNLNEHQVSIGETTFGGREELMDPKAILDYGSLMYITLQRARTAREAIQIMTDLTAEYGYYSAGESFSVADPQEVWFFEMVGKGSGNGGALWVARRIPDGMVSAHANQARIRQFPLNDKQNCLYAKDVISYAREKKYFSGPDEKFSFADAYCPLNYGGLRFCEARVWNFFRRIAPSQNFSIDFVKGVKGAEPMPLWVKPDHPLSVQDVMAQMRDHFEGTEFDMSKDLGAGPFNLPYRWRPLTWTVDSVEYLNERAISTQQTGFSFVAQARSWLPDPIGGVLWFGVDDTYSTVYVPMYCGIRQAPRNFAVGTGSFFTFDWDSAFWVFNIVANMAYSRYSDIIKDIIIVQRDLEGEFFARQAEVENEALTLYKTNAEQARNFLTEYSVQQSEKTVVRWKTLATQLFLKYLDGNVRDELNNVTHPGYPASWYSRIAKETGDNLKTKKLEGETGSH